MEQLHQKLEQILQDSAEQIKEILLEAAKKLKTFPEMLMGVNYPEGSKPDNSVCGIAVPKPGILIDEYEDWFCDKFYIIMMPDGLYELRGCRFTQPKESEYGINISPNWESKRKALVGPYLRYGRSTLDAIDNLLKQQVSKPKEVPLENLFKIDAEE